ncbi:hypothetical protein HL658_35695 [Azospirillum sp. RWY-5-1]|uniref:Uncharacterized protein n=1 Tax=Azospirillum oleiclasticum TaxID=2735135 RepID=A0ABX2TL77_9PROT|nr:hypothetical protein [Azospirillum oleiclasticum]NYZ17916.1 hypothetical protein [Azospirillum oleiclasticum]NYZ25109.1 hypothetical protein [Azospirillum oleiclasticum]
MTTVLITLVLVLAALALSEPLLRRVYVWRIKAQKIEQKAEERILTYPLA